MKRGRQAHTLQIHQQMLSNAKVMVKRRQPTTLFDGQLKSIVILARECYGDAIMLTPLIATLRQTYPEISISIVAFTQIIFDFFSADTNINAVYHAKRNLKRYLFEFFPKKFDVLFNPKNHPSTHFHIQSLIIRAKYKIGHRNTSHEALYNHLIDLGPGAHESTRNLALMGVINNSTQQPSRPYIPQMPVSPEIASFLEALPSESCTGINISAGTPGGHRTFEQWSELVRSFPEERFVIFSAPGDITEKRGLEKPHGNVLPSPSTQNLYEVWQIIKKLKLLVTPDTSLVHIAACSDTPLVALYRHNPADSKEFSPLSTLQEVIVSPTPSVIDIENEVVTAALGRMLASLPVNNVSPTRPLATS